MTHFKNSRGIFLGILALFFVACGAPKEARKLQKPAEYDQTGWASWYGGVFHGKKMANGKRFDQNQLTAAHRTLPFGTKVLVTHLENQKSIPVTITDRGPFIKGRILDVSKKAAKELEFLKQGVARIGLKILP